MEKSYQKKFRQRKIPVMKQIKELLRKDIKIFLKKKNKKDINII